MAEWKCSAARDLPISQTDSWDGAGAKNNIFSWAGWPDDPDSSKAKRAFLAYDASAPDQKGSYKLPFCNVVDGELKADSSGINAASSRLPQTDIPQAVKDSAKAVLDHYKAKMDTDKSRTLIGPDDVFASTARASKNTILNEKELMIRATDRATDPSIFEEEGHSPYFWGADVSSNKIDTYFSAMANSSLRNYAADAEDGNGIVFQNSHKTYELSFGRSLASKHTSGQNSRVSIDFYTIRGLNLNGVGTDQLILGIRSGVISDVSIGFYGGWFRCSVCGKDMFDWSAGWSEMCQHIPGVEYDITDSKGNITDRQVAIAWVEDAHLSEVSAVYDGACPGAAIRKAQIEAGLGRANPEILRMLETRYRMKFSGSNRTIGGITLPEGVELMSGKVREISDQTLLDLANNNGEIPEEETETPEVEEETKTPEAEAEDEESLVEPEAVRAPVVAAVAVDAVAETLRSSLLEAGIKPGEDPRKTLRLLASEVKRMRPLSKDGETYRNDLIVETLAEGVRAIGSKFNEDAYRSMLENSTIENIKKIRDGFQSSSDESGNFESGRSTIDGSQTPIEDELSKRRNSRPVTTVANA